MLEKDHITITWHIDDVFELRPDLTREQAREVLEIVEKRYDASLGISWEDVEDAATIFPK